MKPEYHEGSNAKGEFERTMTALFRVPKDTVKKPQKPMRKVKKSGKD